MKTLLGMKLKALPISLDRVRDLEAIGGPLLTEFRSTSGEPYLYYWCDKDESAHRWLVFRVARSDLVSYCARERTLRSLLLDQRDPFILAVDTNGNGQPIAVIFVLKEALPDDYVPGEESWYDPGEARPAESEPLQDVAISQDWGYEDIAKYPRKYLQAYAFNALFGSSGPTGVKVSDYTLTGGWVFHTLYENFRRSAPPEKAAELESVAFASPGFVRFEVNVEIAQALRESVRGYLANVGAARSLTATLRSWSNHHERLSDDAVRSMMHELGRMISVKTDRLLKSASTVNQAAKILVSYVTRVEFLATAHSGRRAVLVGLPLPPAGSSSKNDDDGNGEDADGI